MTLTNKIKSYCHKIISNKINSCQKHKWACQRFLDDFEKQQDGEYKYVFDADRAEKFLRDWMPLFDHTKGPLAGTPKIPAPVEQFLWGQLYGWVSKEYENRRFRNVYWQVARKNAKSQDLAIVGLYEEAGLGEPCSEVVVAATKKEQTKYVFDEANMIYKRSKLLKNKFKTSYGKIVHLKSDSVFTRFTEEDKTKGDGGNIQCGIIDEYHAHETDEYYNIITSGMKMRKQPVIIIITTAGFDLNNPCYRDEYDYVSKILNPNNPIENDRYLALVCELETDEKGDLIDDIKDRKTWIKANPIVATTKEGIESIESELQIALDKPEKQRDLLTKTFNVWVNMREAGYMNLGRWKKCGGVIPSLKDCNCFLGLDLSSKIDLTSVNKEFLIDGKYIIQSHSFMPEETFETKMKTDKVPYDLWVKDGWITLLPGAIIDYFLVKNWILNDAEKFGYNLHEFCIDPWGAVQISNDLIKDGYTVIEIVQGIKTLSEPTKDLRNMVYSEKVIHDNNPVLGWALGNAICESVDRNENIILSKKKSKQRIDPAAALINSHVRAMIPIEESGPGVIFI